MPASKADLPCQWQSPRTEGMQDCPVSRFNWWEALNDPMLNSLMERAWCQNLDLHLAKLRTLEMRHEMKARYEASKEEFYETWSRVSAEVASAYVTLRYQQQLLKIIEKNIKIQLEGVFLIQDMLQMGISSTIEEKQTEQQLSLLYAKKSQITLSIDKSIHRLSTLLAYSPKGLLCELKASKPLPIIPMDKPIGTPCEWLRLRPDIRKAERNLAAALQIECKGAGNLFPGMSLQGFMAYISGIANVKAQQAYYDYQRVVLNALEETENALAAFYYELEKSRALLEAQRSDFAAFDSIQELNEKGFKSYFEVLTIHRNLLASEEAYLQSRLELLLQYIALYKSIVLPFNSTLYNF